MAVDAALTAKQAAPTSRLLPRLALAVLRIVTPVASVMALWYLAILFSGLPAFVIPRPERVVEVLWVDHAFILEHLWATLQVAAIGFLWAKDRKSVV